MLRLQDYYKTKHWREFRLSITNNKSCKCDICGQKRWEKYKRKEGWKTPTRMEIHHKHYNSLYKEKRRDVMCLCSNCHKYGHLLEILSRRNNLYKIYYENFKAETGWNYERRK